MTTALILDLGKFISRLRYRDIPKEAVDFIHMAFTDTVGVRPGLEKMEDMLVFLRGYIWPK